MSVKKSLIRQRVRDQILTLTGFKEAPQPPQAFGRFGHNVGDKLFSVGFNTTAANDGRQNVNTGVYVSNDLTVTASFVIKPHDQVLSYDNALDHEESIIRVIINPSTPLYTGAQIRYIDSNRTLTDNGDFIFITINFTVLNHIPLT